MGLGENDNLMIDWGESLVNDFCNQEVEKRIKERMPSEEEIEQWMQENRWASARQYVKWLRSRLTQKTEGGGE